MKKIEKEIDEVMKPSETFGTHILAIDPDCPGCAGIDCEEEDECDSEKMMLLALYSKRRNPSIEYTNNYEQERNNRLVLACRYNKKMTMENIKKRIENMKAQVKALQANTELDLATKKKQIARRLEIIKNDQWTLDREIAYMQKANQR